MAARLNPRQDERSRAAIQTTQLCKRLNFFALGLPEPITGRPPEMSDAQIRAALGLLRKTLPDLAVTVLRGDEERPISVSFEWAPARHPAAVNGTPIVEATEAAMEIVWETLEEDDANGGTNHEGAQQTAQK